MLQLRLLRGPLSTEQKCRVVNEYNRLSSNHIRLQNFERWTERSPVGPAVHALLEDDAARIVGHCCAIPIPMQNAGRRLTVSKAEYLFMTEASRSDVVCGFENSAKPAAILLLEHLYQFCLNLGWVPILASAPKAVQGLHRMAGCKPFNLSLHECLFILKPQSASRLTPGLSRKQRLALFLAGAGQRMIAAMLGASAAEAQSVATVPVDSPAVQGSDGLPDGISFPWSPEFLRWHYDGPDYLRLEVKPGSGNCVIVKTQSEAGYFRVCQTQLGSPAEIRDLAREMIRLAKARKATGVRWPIYGASRWSYQALSELRKLAFLSVRRARNLVIYSTEPKSADPENWAFCDSFFTFDY